MTQTRQGAGLATQRLIQNIPCHSEFTSKDTASLNPIPLLRDLSPEAEAARIADRHRVYLETENRPETFTEYRARLQAQAEPAVNDALEKRRAELNDVQRLRANLAQRRELRDRAEDLRANRPSYEHCRYAAHDMWSVDLSEFGDGSNETEVAHLRCKSNGCPHCGPWWLADVYERIADTLDPAAINPNAFHVTIATDAEHRSSLTRKLADRRRNHGDPYAAMTVPALDGRYVVISTMPTPTSTPADYSEALSLAKSAFDLISMTALEIGRNPIEGHRPGYVGDWRTLTNSSPTQEKGTDREPITKRRYLVAHRPTFGDDICRIADAHNARTERNPNPDVHSRVHNVLDLASFEQQLREHGAISTEERKRRRHDRRAYLRWQDEQGANQ